MRLPPWLLSLYIKWQEISVWQVLKAIAKEMVFTDEKLYFGLVLWKICEIDRRATGGMHGRSQHHGQQQRGALYVRHDQKAEDWGLGD